MDGYNGKCILYLWLLITQVVTKRKLGDDGGDGDEDERFYSFEKQQKVRYYPLNWDKVPDAYKHLHMFAPIEGTRLKERCFAATSMRRWLMLCLFMPS